MVVPAGATFSQVTDSLAAHGIVRHRRWFRFLARAGRYDRFLKAGTYEFTPGVSSINVLETLEGGRGVMTRLTVPEGLTLAGLADLVAGQTDITAEAFLAAAQDTAFLRTSGIHAPTAEGFLLPETYFLGLQTSAKDLVRLLVASFNAAWRPAWTARLDTLGLTRSQVVILASIIEGEARVDEERAIIAAVYHNRLRIGMALQADPTVQYAIAQKTGQRKPRLYEKDYTIESPYNTYRVPGLPPGPVNSPGRRSLEAALYPADVRFLYFVAQPDGHHVFSLTYDEHLRATARIRREAARAESEPR